MHSKTTIVCFVQGSLLLLLVSFSPVDAFLRSSDVQRLAKQTCFQSTLGNEAGEWLTHGLLMSSFSDGLKPNSRAIDFLMRGLVASLWKEQQRKFENAVETSAVQSPCCGPDLEALMRMESADSALVDLAQGRIPWQEILSLLVEGAVAPLELRFLYIPTAMYAIRKDSTNSPGTQRQRARADGKKRRNEIVNLISNQLPNKVLIRVVTLDLDDSSIKQPEGQTDGTAFPKDGKAAFEVWKPNLIYVQGGNSFWLYHCIEKGGWGPHIVKACTGEDAAVYCGTSAGAIIMGQSMATACWKQWDDPSVVPGRATYEDWNSVSGFRLVGPVSFFPHMNDGWKTLLHEKKAQLGENESVLALRDDEVCCVHGTHVEVLSSLVQTQ